VILYQLLRLSYAQHENGLDVSVWALLPAFLFTVAVAWRLAKFNISTNQSHSFRGIPSPAAGLVVASFPLILLYQYYNVHGYLVNEWVLYGIIVLLSWLMVCDRRFMALKFKDFSFRNNAMKYFLLGAALVLILLLHWLAVPAIFLLYVLLSVFDKEPAAGAPTPGKDSLDVTV
ncbi:MAG TPA: CDP-alcohol phosphatidyltransferase, partial [Chitinophagaceae bacterium]|nr:CDP-alcohol phosphatidyltransferase [Chitinophagaceae bacterium]